MEEVKCRVKSVAQSHSGGGGGGSERIRAPLLGGARRVRLKYLIVVDGVSAPEAAEERRAAPLVHLR